MNNKASKYMKRKLTKWKEKSIIISDNFNFSQYLIEQANKTQKGYRRIE